MTNKFRSKKSKSHGVLYSGIALAVVAGAAYLLVKSRKIVMDFISEATGMTTVSSRA